MSSKIPNPFSAWIPSSTFHSWITALFYPAVLGTALMAWLAPESLENAPRMDTHWAPVLIAYFAIQYGEGIGRGSTYDRRGLVADTLEILFILAAFDRMNILDVGFMEPLPWLTLKWVLLVVFLIPVANRATRCFVPGPEPKGSEGRWRPWTLTLMSLTAGGVAFAAAGSVGAAALVGLILALYIVVCIPPKSDDVGFWNAFRRDPPKTA